MTDIENSILDALKKHADEAKSLESIAKLLGISRQNFNNRIRILEKKGQVELTQPKVKHRIKVIGV